MSSSKINVTIFIKGEQGSLEIIDGKFRIIEQGFGTVKAALLPGIYKTRARIGDIQHEELFTVVLGSAPIIIKIDSLSFATPIPLQGTSTSHEYHQNALFDATTNTSKDVGLGHSSSLLLFVRDTSKSNLEQLRISSPEILQNYRRSFEGFRLRDTDGKLLLNLDMLSKHDSSLGFSIANVELASGFYVLSYEPINGNHVAMPIQLVSSWQTQFFILVNFPKGLQTSGHYNLNDHAIMMVPLGTQFNPNDDFLRLTEVARYAFMDRRSIITNKLIDELILRKLDNPILELLYAHQLLRESQPNIGLLTLLVERLAKMLGADFPDVLALSLALNHLKGIKTEHLSKAILPPIMGASWRILSHYPEFFPIGSFLCKSAGNLVSIGPWFAWKPFKYQSGLNSLGLLTEISALFSSDVLTSINKQLPFGVSLFNIFKEKILTLDSKTEVDVVRKAVIFLAKFIPWDAIFNHFKTEIQENNLFENLTNLQKSLLPTLQLIHDKLENGEDFSIGEFEQLLMMLRVPLPVLSESLLDLAMKVKEANITPILTGEIYPLPADVFENFRRYLNSWMSHSMFPSEAYIYGGAGGGSSELRRFEEKYSIPEGDMALTADFDPQSVTVTVNADFSGENELHLVMRSGGKEQWNIRLQKNSLDNISHCTATLHNDLPMSLCLTDTEANIILFDFDFDFDFDKQKHGQS